MSKVVSICHSWWCCSPRFLQWFAVFFVANIAGDLVSFPFVHTFWNILHFEGWYASD